MGFFDSFTGASQKNAINEANSLSRTYMAGGYNEARDALTKGYGDARGYIDPYIGEGRSDQTMYRNALGLNGASGSSAAMDAYRTARNPYADYQAGQTTNALMRSYNARGMGMGGTAALAAARANNEQGYGDYQNWLGRLGQQGQQGFNASMTGANMATQNGQQMADLGWNYHNALAGNAINYGNATAAAQTAGAQNWLNLGAGLFGSAIKGFTPGAGGQTPFGNMSKSVNGFFGA